MTTPKSLRKAENAQGLIDFLSETKKDSQYELQEIKFADQSAWSLRDGIISHQSNGFFQVIGLENQDDPTDQKLMLYQPQSALTGLIFCKTGNTIFVLLQARVEPGNTGVIQYGPTIQSTPANYLKLHGGKATAYVEYFTSYIPGCHLITHSMQHDLGGKYYQKSKTHHYLEVKELIETQENMIWASIPAIKNLLQEDNILNADLRSLLAVFDWDNYWWQSKKYIAIYTLPAADHYPLSTYKMTPLDKLKDWEITDKGIESKNGQSTGLGFYKFSATNREVSSWTQPLFQVAGQGIVQLIYKKVDDLIFFLVSLDWEVGISTQQVLYPSYYFSPENSSLSSPHQDGQLIAEIIQCDEGGRFYQNETVYQLIENSNILPNENQFWLISDNLSYCLNQSNICSFQLRCASSIALPLIHPISFME